MFAADFKEGISWWTLGPFPPDKTKERKKSPGKNLSNIQNNIWEFHCENPYCKDLALRNSAERTRHSLGMRRIKLQSLALEIRTFKLQCVFLFMYRCMDKVNYFVS